MMIRTALLPAAALLALAACDAPAPGTSPDPAETAPPATSSAAMPAGLSAEEQFLWTTLTPTAQAQAADYIANGGTLTQFMAL